VLLNRPEQRNAWTLQTSKDMSAALAWCDRTDAVGGVVAGGLPAALDLVRTGRTRLGREAAELGLCHRALPAGEVLDAAARWVAQVVADGAPLALGLAKRLLWDSQASGPGEGTPWAASSPSWPTNSLWHPAESWWLPAGGVFARERGDLYSSII